MNCILCGRSEINKIIGELHVHDKREKKATEDICCANCCQFLMSTRISEIPWEGMDCLRTMLTQQNDPGQGMILRRRRG